MKRSPRTIIFFVASLILMASVTAIQFTKLPPEIPLLYSMPESSSQVVDTWMIGIIPILSFIFININNFIGKKVFKNEVFIRHIIYVTNILIIIVFTYIYVKIIFHVT